MLIKCPECKRDISDKASACPVCGCPISKNREAQTIEQTDKHYKMLMVISTIAFFLFLVSALAMQSVIPVPFLVISLIVHIYAKIGAWWDHG